MSIHVEFVSPERIIFEAEAREIIVRTTDGEIGFLSGHVPFVGVLAVAEARIYDADGTTVHSFAVHRGFVEIANDHCTILSDVAEAAADIDIARAEIAERTASVWSLLAKANLTPKEHTVVTLRFGLDGTNEWRTLAEVARHMNCSREYCRQVVQRALRKLRKTGIQSGLVESTL